MITEEIITEDYISFEVAKLLKEKGFDEPVMNFYTSDRKPYIGVVLMRCTSDVPDVYPMLTIQMAMKWLRKVHRLEIYPFHEMLQGSAWWYRIERNTGLSLIVEKEEDAIYGTYEQACEFAIKYCLEKLI